ncbi:hypothetical protein STAS_32022 [Striga asiatica]|uniref:Uncharacterized protein n=1 Tax=Striga asiatica TaxID=4170 RepID=A0A5A7RAU4_STRAF|nr:hypothetical protein STAS_32022 [Striga asiatica]
MPRGSDVWQQPIPEHPPAAVTSPAREHRETQPLVKVRVASVPKVVMRARSSQPTRVGVGEGGGGDVGGGVVGADDGAGGVEAAAGDDVGDAHAGVGDLEDADSADEGAGGVGGGGGGGAVESEPRAGGAGGGGARAAADAEGVGDGEVAAGAWAVGERDGWSAEDVESVGGGGGGGGGQEEKEEAQAQEEGEGVGGAHGFRLAFDWSWILNREPLPSSGKYTVLNRLMTISHHRVMISSLRCTHVL